MSAPTLSTIPSLTLDDLRLEAKRLHRAHMAGEAEAIIRLRQHPPRRDPTQFRRADFLHVIAQEQGFASWPALKFAAETQGLDRAARVQRLKLALHQGQVRVAAHLLGETPDLAQGLFGLACALYNRAEVAQMLAEDPARATQPAGPRRPILHLAFSRWLKQQPEREDDMLAVAELLLAHGADANDSYAETPGCAPLSALYGAIRADNMALARWLLEHGATPDDGESLYHATELGHHDGLRLLLDHGANPNGTNALLRAMDFNDHAAVELLLDHGARLSEPDDTIPALHHAARRGCDRRMADLLLDAGADATREWQWTRPYAYARALGCTGLAAALGARGEISPLSREEALLARAAEGQASPGAYIDPEALPPAYRGLMSELAHRPERLEQIRALVALGVPHDRPDGPDRIPPIQIAGWNGTPEVMGYLLGLRPDLSHVNAHGGTLLNTIIHGSEHAPDRAERDHITCLRLVLEHGVALPRSAIRAAGREDIAAFLADWAEAKPGQVV